MNWFKRVTGQREFMIGAIVFCVIVAMSFASPYFLSSGNLLALLLGLSIEAIIAVAMTNLMVSGGFDMSVGSIVAVTGAATALLLANGAPIAVAVAAGIALYEVARQRAGTPKPE